MINVKHGTLHSLQFMYWYLFSSKLRIKHFLKTFHDMPRTVFLKQGVKTLIFMSQVFSCVLPKHFYRRYRLVEKSEQIYHFNIKITTFCLSSNSLHVPPTKKKVENHWYRNKKLIPTLARPQVATWAEKKNDSEQKIFFSERFFFQNPFFHFVVVMMSPLTNRFRPFLSLFCSL